MTGLKPAWAALRGDALRGLHSAGSRLSPVSSVDFYCSRARLVVEVDGGVPTAVRNTTASAMRHWRLGLVC